MKEFLIKIVLFALLIFLVDKLFIIIRNKAPEYDYDRRLEMILEGNINKDIIILGSSRGQRNIDVQLMKDSLNTESVFNLSYGGSTPEFQGFILDQLIKNNQKPKLIIKLVDDDFELMNKGLYGNAKAFRIDRLNPLAKYQEIRECLYVRGVKNEVLSKLFILHQLNRSNFNLRKKGVIDTIYGAKPIEGHDSSLVWRYKSKQEYNRFNEEDLQIKNLINLQKKCLKNDIELILATAPVFREVNEIWIERMRQLAIPNTLFYTHEINEKAYKEKDNFADYSHLNNKGAAIYTQEIINFIKDNGLELH
ncbi:hypothetical protein [Winogradskyella rapida]|uniref:SGNH/GDSL hydrolase family protein n=1 Tax=Winogradskyella rapida TaxID=549701 RepID=A0ABW3KS66_9FLAO